MSAVDVDVSVLVPVLNEAAVLRDTVARMLAQRFDGTLEFLLVDGGSTDGTRALLAELAGEDERIRVLDNPATHVPAALNIGLAAARGRFVARMDAHTWYPPDYVALGVQRLGRGDVEWVTGPAVPRAMGGFSRAVAGALGLTLGRGGSRKWAPENDSEVDLDTGVFGGVWARETLERLGGWREEWTVNEDSEMAGRVLSAGGRIVSLPRMAGDYAPRDSARALARQYWRFGFFRVKTSRRHPIALRRFHLLAAGLALVPPVAILAPRDAARVARGSLVLYGAVVARAALRAPGEHTAAERLQLALALAVMHFSWGAGFVAGCIRFGPPWRGLAHVLAPGGARRALSRPDRR